MTANPPCYRCESTTPLPAGQVGLCRPCEVEVEQNVGRKAIVEFCPHCSIEFYNDWERIQHLVRRRHNYRAWTPAEGKQLQEKLNDYRRGTVTR